MTLSPVERVDVDSRATTVEPPPDPRQVGAVREPPLQSGAPKVGGKVPGRVLVSVGLVAIFLMSLYPRLVGLGGYLTTDEGNWMGRTALFTRALLDGDPAGTYQSGHPGVMTMWASLIGMGPERSLGLVEYVRPDGLEKAPDYLDTLRQARRSFAVLTSLAVVAVAMLTWRLFGAGPGLLTGVLLGLEPFFLAHSVVAHVDSNVTAWMTISLLAALVYFWANGGRAYLALSGAAAGLAFLSKAPSAFLPLFVPMVAVTAVLCRQMSLRGKPSPSEARLPQP
ncbi:MAG: glycosyltransferase family 39 protein, partial [Chloroflexi bacterium]|nr:glycosyltransferase family 39 protein [Chloroflexota bacterium]